MASKTQKKRQSRRRGKRDNSADRHDASRQQHQEGGGEWECLTPPKGLQVFSPKADKTYRMDLIPTTVGPYNKAAKEGFEWFEFSYQCYNNLGVESKRYVALHALTGERDPVAAHFARVRNDGVSDWDDIKDFKPKDRQMFLVFVHEQADKGLQFWETSYKTFGELLRKEIDAEEEDYVKNLDDVDGGATVKVRFEERDIGHKNKWIKADKITFIEREDGFDADGDEELAEAVLDAAEAVGTLDSLLKVPTYEQLEAALNGEPVGGDEDGDEDAPEPEPEKPQRKPRKGKSKPDPEPEDGDEDDVPMWHKGDLCYHEEHGDSTITRVNKSNTCTLRDEDGELQKQVPLDELQPRETTDEDTEPEPEPEQPKRKSRARTKDPEPEPDPEPEDDGDEDGDEDDWDEDWD